MIAIRVEKLSKQYSIGLKYHHDTLRDHLAHGFGSLFGRNGSTDGKDSPDEPQKTASNQERFFWALKDVSFEVKKGEIIGVIGGNGAGKSTLLKILSRITAPTRGSAQIHGRVGSLLEVGTGFHPELTGRENIFLNGAILGMKRAEIERKFDEIVAFSEIEQFIDTAVKRYSSGMYVRLAFAVAAHLEPEVLFIDEVLAVGDVGFQRKCLGTIQGVAGQGRTVLFVSHNMATVEHLCSRAIVLQRGEVAFAGSAKDAVEFYLQSFSDNASRPISHIVDLWNVPRRLSKYRPALQRMELATDQNKPLNGPLRVGDSLTVMVSFRLDNPKSHFDVILGFDDHLGQRVFTASSAFQPNRNGSNTAGDQRLACHIPSLTLIPGEYRLKVLLDVGGVGVDRVEDVARIHIVESDYYGTGKMPKNGFFVLKHNWYHV